MMRKRLFFRNLVLACGATTLSAGVALAAPHGGGGMGPGMGGMSGAQGEFGGMSASHMNPQGTANTNGPTATDRDFGRDRAEDRMSAKSNGRASASNGVRASDRDFGGDRAADRAHRHHRRHHHH